MGKCIYCGQPAGFLRWRHAECRKQHKLAVIKIPEVFASKALAGELEAPRFRALVEDSARKHYVSDAELRKLVILGLQKTIAAALDHQELSEQNDARIATLCKEFGLNANDLGSLGTRFVKAEVLQRLDLGKLSGLKLDGCDINFERGESAIWAFKTAEYYTTRTRTRYVGSSLGVSVRVVKGVYLRSGTFRGEPIKTQYLSKEGQGVFVVASRNVYFSAPLKAVKIPLKKIVSVHAYSDGVQLMRDGANAAPQIFKLDDPLFAADLILRLNQISGT
jgi:hypothetical protein